MRSRLLKKIGVLTVIGAMVISAAGCGGSAGDSTTGNESAQTEEAQSENSAPQEENGQSENSAEQEEAQSEQATYSDIEFKTIDTAEDDENYITDLLEAEIYNYKLIRNLPTAYEEEGWDDYCSKANILLTIDASNISDTQVDLIKKASDAKASLVQIKAKEDAMWYLWGDSIPMTENAEELEFTVDSYDNSDFEPFLVPYLLEDQTSVKGNMIIIAGGGYSTRGNSGEGYPIAEAFNELGYNCYVLQRRVEPYGEEDIWMDMQRSIRVVKNKIDTMGLGGADLIGAAGFSGGSATILGAVVNLYGDILPTVYDDSYTPDDIDTINADLDVVCAMYGPDYTKQETSESEEYAGLVTENENIPAMFIAAGADDDTGAPQDNVTLANSVADKTTVELHTFANVGHGFGVGTEGTNSSLWITLADGFIDQIIGTESEDEVSADVEVPEEYTVSQSYEMEFSFGKTQVTIAENEDHTGFYVYFTAFEELQVLEGTIDADGTVTVTFDKTGFMSGDAQTIVDTADPNAWE